MVSKLKDWAWHWSVFFVWMFQKTDMSVRDCWNYARAMERRDWPDDSPVSAVECERSYWDY